MSQDSPSSAAVAEAVGLEIEKCLGTATTETIAKAIQRAIDAAINDGSALTPSPTATEQALGQAKGHIAILTGFWMDNPYWTEATARARSFLSAAPEQADT